MRTVDASDLLIAGAIVYRRGDVQRARTLLALAAANVSEAGGGASVLDEGATRGGQTLVEEGGVRLDAGLTRWRSLGERTLDVEAEYGAPRD